MRTQPELGPVARGLHDLTTVGIAIVLFAAILMACIYPYAHAADPTYSFSERWVTLGKSPYAGTIRLDTDSIRQLDDGLMAANTDRGADEPDLFDCAGHWFNALNRSHNFTIPPGTIMAAEEALVCSRYQSGLSRAIKGLQK